MSGLETLIKTVLFPILLIKEASTDPRIIKMKEDFEAFMASDKSQEFRDFLKSLPTEEELESFQESVRKDLGKF